MLFPPQPAFRTLVELNPYPWPKWKAGQPIYAIGSCFADHIGTRLIEGGCQGVCNPFGTIFNPISLAATLLKDTDWFMEDAISGQQGWVCYHAHSRLVSENQSALEQKIAQLIDQRNELLSQNPVLILTLGTAFAWQLHKNNNIVANCHKQPIANFERKLVSTDAIVEALAKIIFTYPDLKVVLTVSPVRHTKESMQGNAVSKATLIVACHQLVGKHPNNFYYFPSYELMMDDLRDYRFYEKDLIHPNGVAIDYIWNALLSVVATPDLISSIKEGEKRSKAIGHIKINP
jgi:hypothetical protein